MADISLETAVLGLNEAGRELLDAADQLDHFRICAVAGKDPGLLEKLGAQHQCEVYDDYRQLLVRGHIDCLLVAAPIHMCDEYLRTAMEQKFNILKPAPFARNFEEAAELVRLAAGERVQLAVGNPGRFAPKWQAARDAFASGEMEGAFLIEAHCWVTDEPINPWQSDPKLAGGGVLLHQCYEVIDQIVSNLPLPQQVYALTASQAHDKQQRLYVTEDTAVVTMRFSDTLIANVVASRRKGAGHNRMFLKVYGPQKTLTVDDACTLTRSVEGRRDSRQLAGAAERAACVRDMLESFALSVSNPEEHKLVSGGRQNLRNMAVIEAAYLSARTAMPEEPARILQMAQFQPDDLQGGL